MVGIRGSLDLSRCTLASTAWLAEATTVRIEDTVLTELPAREGGYTGSFKRVPLDESSAALLKDRDPDSLDWCRRVAPLGLVAHPRWATVSFLAPGPGCVGRVYERAAAHRHDEALALVEAGDVGALVTPSASPVPPTNHGPEPAEDAPEWATWAAMELRRATPELRDSLIDRLSTRVDATPCAALAATLRGHFVYGRNAGRVKLARLHASPLLDAETRSWFVARIAADPHPPVRETLGGDAWADCPVSPLLRTRLRALGASWNASAAPHPDLPEPFDRLANGLVLPDGLVRRQRHIHLFAWDPEEPGHALLVADARRWIRIGMAGDYHELYLALEGDDPLVVELDHDGSDEVLIPETLSRWLLQAVIP